MVQQQSRKGKPHVSTVTVQLDGRTDQKVVQDEAGEQSRGFMKSLHRRNGAMLGFDALQNCYIHTQRIFHGVVASAQRFVNDNIPCKCCEIQILSSQKRIDAVFYTNG